MLFLLFCPCKSPQLWAAELGCMPRCYCSRPSTSQLNFNLLLRKDFVTGFHSQQAGVCTCYFPLCFSLCLATCFRFGFVMSLCCYPNVCTCFMFSIWYTVFFRVYPGVSVLFVLIALVCLTPKDCFDWLPRSLRSTPGAVHLDRLKVGRIGWSRAQCDH